MTRATMRGLLRRRLQETTANHWTDDNLNDLLEIGLQEMQSYLMGINPDAFIFLYQRDIVDDNDIYEWPIGFDYEFGVYKKNTTTNLYERLEKMAIRRVIDANYTSDREAVYRYGRLGQYVQLSPIPDENIVNGLRIYFMPTFTMSDDSTVPLIPVRLHYGAVLLAARFALPQAGQEAKLVEDELVPILQKIPLWYRSSAEPGRIDLDLDKEY